jgi:hypothetical protein
MAFPCQTARVGIVTHSHAQIARLTIVNPAKGFAIGVRAA